MTDLDDVCCGSNTNKADRRDKHSPLQLCVLWTAGDSPSAAGKVCTAVAQRLLRDGLEDHVVAMLSKNLLATTPSSSTPGSSNASSSSLPGLVAVAQVDGVAVVSTQCHMGGTCDVGMRCTAVKSMNSASSITYPK